MSFDASNQANGLGISKPGQDWNSLITQGSFGFDETDVLVGIEGDRPIAEPVGGSATNSRLSDELWVANYNESGLVAVGFQTSNAWMSTYALVVEMTPTTGVSSAPLHAASLEAFPNPFNPSTRIRYSVPASAPISLALFDVRGRLVETIVNDEFRMAGDYEVDYRPELNSGVYVLRLSSSGGVTSRKIVLLK